MRIIGIDPGIAIMGYGIIDDDCGKFKVLEYGAITTVAGIKKSIRLKDIYDGTISLIEKYRPDVMAIEELFLIKMLRLLLL